MKKRLILFIFLLSSITYYLYARDMLDYDELVKLPASELIRNGDEYLKLNHTDTAMGYYIILAGKYNTDMNKSDKYLCAMACISAGEIYYEKENYSKAFELYFKGIRICEENDFGELLAQLYKDIGNIYSVFEDYQQAIDTYKKALEYAKSYGNTTMEIKLLMNLAGICCYGNLTEDAKMYYDEMMKFVGKDSLIEYFGYLNKALILTNEEKNDSAIICFEKSAEYANRVHLNPQYIASSYGELANLYEQIGQNDSALYYFHANAEFTEKNNLMYMLIVNLKALSRLYEEKGDYKKSLHYKNRYLIVSDSLLNMNEFNKMKNTQFVYEMDKNYQKIASLTADQQHKEIQIKTQKRILIIVSVSLFIFIILLIVVYIQKGKLHHAYKDLFSRNSEILQSEQQNKRLRIKYETRLAEERARRLQLEQNILEPSTKGTEDLKKEEAEEAEETKLYSANKLTNEQKENLLRDITRIMEETEEFCDSEFSLERLASLIGSNSRYVSQIINETYNKNFRTFVNEYRIKEARIRLMNTAEYENYTIKAIAESVGYKSHTNFIDIFKKITGITPSIYQKIAKEGKRVYD